MREDQRSSIWGGGTAGLFIGLIIGIFTDNYWNTVFISIAIGAGLGVIANILSFFGDRLRKK